jgi:hypothetical protein
MLQAAFGDDLAFDPFAFEKDFFRPFKIDIGGNRLSRLALDRAQLSSLFQADEFEPRRTDVRF